jgi:uncharacterized membrane protein
MSSTAEYSVRVSRRAVVTPIQPASSARLEGIDLVRGLVIVIMALDHTRDFFSQVRFDPADMSQTTTALFLTRWITHFCAPAFMLLAGISAALVARKKSLSDLSRFLLTRGLWLILLEFTVVNLGWQLNLRFHAVHAQVIWALGASMVVLAGLVRLPRGAVAAVALTMIFGHNLLDGISPAQFGALAPLWQILHVRGVFPGTSFELVYPLIPWIGVMAAGYLLGPLWTQWSRDSRRHGLAVLGASMMAGFVVLRIGGVYGDPSPWDIQSPHPFLSLLNTTKYPPSLQYLLMTLGPTFLLLAAVDSGVRTGFRWLVDFGRVPLFFYVAHIYLIHATAAVVQHLQGYTSVFQRPLPDGYGFGLPVVYLVWAGVIATLYPFSLWYGRVKARGRGWWWGYL